MLDMNAEWKIEWRNLRPSNGVRLHLGNDLWYKAARFPAIVIPSFLAGKYAVGQGDESVACSTYGHDAYYQALKTHMHRHMVPGAAGSV